ncbi:hypothetical protein HPB48_026466 [Haemaphysalis longicornis]|uniref:RING-type E3 ubiquitin transferase n=1 Tax=Haemaphysalis longicornis TaxID=44386 RepID=A0A9J6H9T8_HAELO|nr:hypothetical protein HPB48_026466 [Haemaphysalis longicornis]
MAARFFPFPSRLSVHEGVSCDACSRSDFRGKRYKCLICYDYDLCETCYEEEATSKGHSTEHAVQCILTPSDWELYYAGEPADQPHSFTCPMCSTMGFTLAGLREHVSSEHTETATHVVCPVCAATPGGEPNRMTGDLALHLSTDHARSRHLQDEEPFSRRLLRVSQFRFGAVGNPVPGRQPQRPSSLRVTIPPSSPPDSGSSSTISDLQSQASAEARRTSTLPRVTWAVPEVQGIRMRLEATRQELQAAYQEHIRPRLRDAPPAVTSVYSVPPARIPEPVDAPPKPTLVEPPPPDDPRFLLNGIIEASVSDSRKQALEVERADRSLFVQELLLSTLALQTPVGPDGPWGESTSQGETTRPDASATIAPEPNAATSSKKPATTGAESAVNTSPEQVHAKSQKPAVNTCLEPNVTTSSQSAAIESQDSHPLTSLEPGAGDLAQTTTTSTEPTTPTTLAPSTSASSGLADHKPEVDSDKLPNFK